MKTNFKTLYLFLVAILVYNNQIFTQQSSAAEQEFPIGAFLSILPENRTNPALYSSFEASGMNTIVPYANDATKQYLLNYNVIPWNQDPTSQDWIQYYITGYYSKWEAEEDKPFSDTVGVGVKHKYGQSAYWKDSVLCWSTKGITTAKDSVMFGPHYHQEKFYRRFLENSYDLKYVPRINMALDYNPVLVNQNEVVCRIKVVYRYTIVEGIPPYPNEEITLLSRTLKVSDFNSDSTFKDITFGLPPNTTYAYDSIFREGSIQNKMLTETQNTPFYSDVFTDNGIQFCVDWLRNDTLCDLYIDYAEVYDNNGWNFYLNNPSVAYSQITNYSRQYSTTWNNIKYWYGHDEPYTIDAITPSQIVSSIVQAAGGAPIITAQLIDVPPIWSPVNGELLYKRYFNMVQPEKLMIDYYPIVTERTMSECLEILRAVLTEAHSMQPGFWYVGQAMGLRDVNSGEWCHFRKPDPVELKAMTMLSLAHGIKGLLFWNYDLKHTYDWDPCTVEYDCIVNKVGEEFIESELWYVIKNNLAPRLKGKLGNTLLELDYTGNYLPLKRLTNFNQIIESSASFLKLKSVSTGNDLNFHAGFFINPNQGQNNYFLLTNLITSTSDRQVEVTVNANSNPNMRFRNVEPAYNFDMTYTDQTTQTLTFPAGEGYLFQVAPVVKYGGKLILVK